MSNPLYCVDKFSLCCGNPLGNSEKYNLLLLTSDNIFCCEELIPTL